MTGEGKDATIMAINAKRRERALTGMTLQERVAFLEREQEEQGALVDHVIEELRKIREKLQAKRDTGDVPRGRGDK